MTAEDGGIEATELTNHPFFLGIQFHAELREKFDKKAGKIFEEFFKAVRK